MQLSKNKPSLQGEAENIGGRPTFSTLVGVPGVEPGTSSLSGTRSNQLSYTPYCAPRLRRAFRRASPRGMSGAGFKCVNLARQAGGGNRVRTGDPELAKLVLYQLSYAPSTFAAPASSDRLIPAPWRIRRRRPSYKRNHAFRTGNGMTCATRCKNDHCAAVTAFCPVNRTFDLS